MCASSERGAGDPARGGSRLAASLQRILDSPHSQGGGNFHRPSTRARTPHAHYRNALIPAAKITRSRPGLPRLLTSDARTTGCYKFDGCVCLSVSS
ncbi:jg1412 [Pararge aegeria aegeria]|uniref:Jg1412 protein n=1 Tax=Pararge aegeria aegeria TaxID=348720 RepID=A0A8S4R0F3_9NEOP|nr:jg1412 [Pararge aegeria aegeria]